MKKYILISTLACSLGLFSCTSDFEELDFPKTTSVIIDPAPILTRSFVTGSGLSVGIWQNTNQLTTLDWVQYVATIKANFTSAHYEPSPANSVWSWWYSDEAFAGLHLCEHAIELSQKIKNVNHEAIARIWRAYMFQYMTDCYGDIPYSEAFKSVAPKYDSQEFIYKDLISQLQTAVSTLSANKNSGYTSLGTADVFFNGDLDKWIKFGNSMILRLAMQCSNVAADEITKTTLASIDWQNQSLYISANEDNVRLIPDEGGATYHVKNPYAFVAGWDEMRISKTMYDRLAVNQDPRMHIYMAKNINGEYIGLPSGQRIEDLNAHYKDDYIPNYCDIGDYFIQGETPFVLFTASEVHFLLAEAIQKGFIQGDATTFYNKAVRLSLESYNIPDEQIQSFMTKVPYSEENLYTQFWLALFPNGPQGWNLVRRTGKPSIAPLIYHWPGNSDMPRRYSYSTDEIRYNPINVQEAIERMGGDSQYTRIWWDKN